MLIKSNNSQNGKSQKQKLCCSTTAVVVILEVIKSLSTLLLIFSTFFKIIDLWTYSGLIAAGFQRVPILQTVHTNIYKVLDNFEHLGSGLNFAQCLKMSQVSRIVIAGVQTPNGQKLSKLSKLSNIVKNCKQIVRIFKIVKNCRQLLKLSKI